MGKKRSTFERWRARAPAQTRKLAELVEMRITPYCEAAGFTSVSVWMGDKDMPVRGDEIQLERSAGEDIDIIDISFAKYRAPRFQLGCARRCLEPPHAFRRSANLVASNTEYFHFWGKPWWRPEWSWSTRDAERAVEGVAAKLDQVFAFLESGVVGPNISRQDDPRLHRANERTGNASTPQPHMNVPDHSSVVPAVRYLHDHADEASEIEAFIESAKSYLREFSWFGGIEEEYVGAAFPGIIGILLFRIRPTRANVDEWLWVLVGDLPPIYLTCDECKNPWEALDGYLGAMGAWVEAAQAGRPVDGLVPVKVEPSPSSAEALQKRLKFLDTRIMPILKERLPG